MKWILIAVAALFLLVALMAVIGALLPKGHVATVRARLRKAPDAVFRVITDYPNLAEWRADVKAVEMLPPRDGNTVYRETGKNGKITYEVMESSAPNRLLCRIADPDLPFGGSWTWSIEPVAEGCSITITEDGEVYNPLFRFLSKFVFGQTKTMESYLRALGKKFGEDVAPEVITA
jgi:hypothetical protein